MSLIQQPDDANNVRLAAVPVPCAKSRFQPPLRRPLRFRTPKAGPGVGGPSWETSDSDLIRPWQSHLEIASTARTLFAS